MPRELPRHELTHDKAKKEYDTVGESAKKREKRSGRDIENPVKRTARTATHVIADALQSVTAAHNGLTMLYANPKEGFSGGKSEDLRVQARASSTDLAGYFNDYKLSLEPGNRTSPNHNRLFDWLELAEQKGGIGDWLTQWNALMRDPSQRTDYSRMADIADSIRTGIEFQKALIREMGEFEGDPSSTDPDNPKTPLEAPEEATSVFSLLNSVGFEISRQLGEALANRFETGSQLIAARNSLKQNNARERDAERVRQAVKNLSTSEAIRIDGRATGELSKAKSIVDPLIDDLKQWESAAAKMSGLVETIGTPEYPGDMMEKSIAKDLMNEQIKVVTSIGDAAKAFFDLDVRLTNPFAMSVYFKEGMLFNFAQIAGDILEQQRSFAAQLRNPQMKQSLIQQADLAQNICTMIEKKRQDQRFPRYYEQALTATQDGTLRDLWSKTRTQIVDQVKQAGGKQAAADLEQLFKANLGEKLDGWVKRKKSPQDIYGLAWQLVATLREYESGANDIFHDWRASEKDDTKQRYAQFLDESMSTILDAMSGAVAQGLDEDIMAGRG